MTTPTQAAALSTPPAQSGEPTDEQIAAEAVAVRAKMIVEFAGPVVSFDVRDPYYLASCDACGWVGSSEHCGTDSDWDDSDVYCPRCHASGADCGKVANTLTPDTSKEGADVEERGWAWLDATVGATGGGEPADLTYSADQMVDAFIAGAALRTSQPPEQAGMGDGQ